MGQYSHNDVSSNKPEIAPSSIFTEQECGARRACVNSVVAAVGLSQLRVIVIGGFDGTVVKALLDTGTVSRVYSVDDYVSSDTDAIRSKSNVVEAEKQFDRSFCSDSRVVKIRCSHESALQHIQDKIDLVYITGANTAGSVVSAMRAMCNVCEVMGGDCYDIADVRTAISTAYGDCVVSSDDGSWFIRDPRRKCCIVIPVYNAYLDRFDEESIRRCITVFSGRYDIFMVCPESYDATGIPDDIRSNMTSMRFDDRFFVSREAYCRLCWSREFYARFSAYTHMLVYQLDGYVFRDDLFERWMRYDYVGAPWCLYCKECSRADSGTDCVGNGGVSLRRIDAFLSLIGGPVRSTFPEDMALTVPRFNPMASRLKKPACREAIEFSLETVPQSGDTDYKVPSFTHALHWRHPELFSKFKRMAGIVDVIRDKSFILSASTGGANEEPFSCFDAVFVISASVCAGRHKSLVSELNRVGIHTFIPVVWGVTPISSSLIHVLGYPYERSTPGFEVTLEHYSAINTAYWLGLQRILVLEDDVRMMTDVSTLRDAIRGLPDDFDVAKLEWIPMSDGQRKLMGGDTAHRWIKANGLCTGGASATAYSAAGMRKFLTAIERDMAAGRMGAIDGYFSGPLQSECKIYLSLPVCCVTGGGRQNWGQKNYDGVTYGKYGYKE